ncbi:MAG: hypothetical protein EZS28_031864 [Streblomastix strix]|uniref:Uncharacterized protein n=1 Tax=Streblomastix strix TaxID=222440 RepID=A0A5J4UQ48_9EUKA|nr:MAG: hypothetical protein EZS28_031864 [Streblomastix strix]
MLIKLPSTQDKRSVSVSNKIGQSESTSIKDGILGRYNDSEQGNNQRTKMQDIENSGQPTRVIDQQNIKMHVNNRRITAGLGSDSDIRQSNRNNTTQLLEQERSRNDRQRQGNQGNLLRTTPFRASLQENVRSGILDTFRQHNSSLRYLEMEIEGIPDRKNKTSIFSSEKALTTNHNHPHPRKTELNVRFYLVTMQIGRLHPEGHNNQNDLQDMQLHAIDRRIHKTIQQTNQQICNSGSQRPGDTLLQILQKMKQDKADGIIIAPIWPEQSWYTKLKNLSTRFLFLGQADKILEMGQRMKDKDQKLPPSNVGAFFLDLSQTQEETYQ